MKKMKLAALALALTGIFAAGNALAANTATLDVSATVIAACQFDSDGGTLAFADLDVLTPTDQLGVTPSGQPMFTCTNGTTYTITDDSATNPLSNGTDNIVYSLSYTSGGTANGTSTAMDVTGSLLGTAYAGKSVGTYNAQVTFTINP